jgi:hypothetical protein
MGADHPAHKRPSHIGRDDIAHGLVGRPQVPPIEAVNFIVPVKVPRRDDAIDVNKRLRSFALKRASRSILPVVNQLSMTQGVVPDHRRRSW